LGQRRISAVLLVAAPLLALAVNREQWPHEFRVRSQMSEEARFFYSMPQGLLRRPLTAAPTMRELASLKAELERSPAAGTAFYDDYFLCTADLEHVRAWQYDAMQRAVVEITPSLAAIARRHCRAIRHDAPLAVEFHYFGSALHWRLGPYPDGRYTALIANGLQAAEVRPRDGLYLPAAAGLPVRIRYDSPAGWTTYSPELSLDFVHQPRVSWSRR
jgi:hypothetical protein